MSEENIYCNDWTVNEFEALIYIFVANRELNAVALKTLNLRLECGNECWKYLIDILSNPAYRSRQLCQKHVKPEHIYGKTLTEIRLKMESEGLETKYDEIHLIVMIPALFNHKFYVIDDSYYKEFYQLEGYDSEFMEEFKPFTPSAKLGEGYSIFGPCVDLHVDDNFIKLFFNLIEVEFEYIHFRVNIEDYQNSFYVVKNTVSNTYDCLGGHEFYSHRERCNVMLHLLYEYLLYDFVKSIYLTCLCKEDTKIFTKNEKIEKWYDDVYSEIPISEWKIDVIETQFKEIISS